ncbi:MAG: class I SAM-dependent methyltransferase [Chitinophagales bacterium]|nr:class I SAM-dependent methyltransferase [Chitinophagales bacterium]
MKWHQLKSFIQFYLKAHTIYNVQSGFLYQLLHEGLDTSKTYYIYDKFESLRIKLLKNDAMIEVNDYGAGSHVLGQSERKISQIAATSLSDKNKCRILFQLVEYFNCKQVLELGTSLGISSLYLAAPAKDIQVRTIEGDPHIAEIAKNIHADAGMTNIQIIQGRFQDVLSDVLRKSHRIDLAFIDGHHSELPTIDYFDQILQYSHRDTILVIDDIYWSEEMTRAWQKIVHHPEVTLALDLYSIGIVFLNKNLSKQYVRYIPYHYKPWKIGLFG